MPNYFQKAINAAFYANPVKLQKLIDEGHFNVRLLEDTGFMTKPFPIWRIPQCWEAAIGDVSHWNKEVQYLITDFKSRVIQVKEIFRNSFNIEFSPIDYRQYTDDFYAARSDESIEEALWLDSIEDAYKNGARPIDTELYYAGVQFDFARTEELLKHGANPDIPLEEYDMYLYDRIATEASFLEVELRHVWKFEFRGEVDYEDISHLVGYAAHETMYDLLVKYHKSPEDDTESAVSYARKQYVYGPDTDANSAKVWWITNGPYADFMLVMDASCAWILEMPFGEKNLDNYRACITGYTKDFMTLYGGQTHKELALNIHHVHWKDDSFDSFFGKVKGHKGFKVLDFRIGDDSPELDKYIKECADRRYNVSQEYFMYWYQSVSKLLLDSGLPESRVIDFLKKHPIQVGLIYAHGNGLTPEHLARRLLEKPSSPKEFDEYAKPKIRVTKKRIADYRIQLEEEFRKFLPNEIFDEEFIQRECYGVSDETIAYYLRQQSPPADVAYYATL